jgi:small subunit ribosomal protein S9
MTQSHYYYGTGRRKTSVARVRLYNKKGPSSINGKTFEEAFPLELWRGTILEPLKAAGSDEQFSFIVNVDGGGVSSQAGAIRHGITRALLQLDPNLRKALREQGFITRDSRIKESKKYGLKRARRAPQYTKR